MVLLGPRELKTRISTLGLAPGFLWVAVKELNLNRKPLVPLKGSFKGDIDRGIFKLP